MYKNENAPFRHEINVTGIKSVSYDTELFSCKSAVNTLASCPAVMLRAFMERSA